MKNEIIEFFQKHEAKLEFMINDSKIILNNNKINDEKSFTLMQIIYEFIKEEKIDQFLSEIEKNINESNLFLLSSFIKEEGLNIVDYFSLLKFNSQEEYLKLIDFEWKFIGLSTIDKFEVGEMMPKILLKLFLNNGKNQIIETDYAGLVKFQEEIEENLVSFNSTYSRRIETFTK